MQKGECKMQNVTGRTSSILQFAFFILPFLLAGCGTMGPPVAPETLGVTQKLLEEKERARAAKAKEQAGEAPRALEAGEEVVLPPVRPVGTR
jgi:hypothetical protein